LKIGWTQSRKVEALEDTDWIRNVGGGFGNHTAEDELFHGWGDPADSMSETWFWNFHVPEAKINCFAFCWTHPNLKVVTGGLMIYKGFKRQHLASELFDLRDYNALDAIVGDGSDIKFPNGMRVQVIKPLEELHFTFNDAGRDTQIDLNMSAVGVPIMRANNQHFEQVMHVTGDLVLRGERHVVDCYAVRDRSWGEPRPETHAPLPPYLWVTGSFGEDFSFNVGSHDDPDRNPDWLGKMDVPEHIFKDGWVVVSGEQRRIVRSSKITEREFPLCRPLSHDFEFEDDAGITYRITGKVIAQSNWSGWSNMNCHLGLVEWNWNGRIGYGETQECQWNDYIYKMGQG
jgi:hypothetical protein